MARAIFSEGVRRRFELFSRRPVPLHDLPGLCAFLTAEAAHVAQSATYDYLRARSGRFGPMLFREKPFLDAVELTRWEAYAAVLGDLAVIVEGLVRPLAHDSAALASGFVAVHRDALHAYPPPAHRADGWAGVEADFARRLAAAIAEPVAGPAIVAGHSGAAIFASLPIHPDVRRLDEEMVVNSLRVRLILSHETLKKRADLPALTAALGGSTGSSAGR